MTEIQSYIHGWRERALRSEETRKQRMHAAQKSAALCAQTLIDEFNATRVFLIGSLAEGGFRLNSDIDLIVEGLAPQSYFHALSCISRLAGDIEVDLIPWESYKYKAEVLEKGRLLYEADNK